MLQWRKPGSESEIVWNDRQRTDAQRVPRDGCENERTANAARPIYALSPDGKISRSPPFLTYPTGLRPGYGYSVCPTRPSKGPPRIPGGVENGHE